MTPAEKKVVRNLVIFTVIKIATPFAIAAIARSASKKYEVKS